MPAALITIIQTALLQQDKSSPDRSDSKIGCGGKAAASPTSKDILDVVAAGHSVVDGAEAPKSQGGFCGDFAALIQELAKVAHELAHVDSMLIEARTSAPEDEQARKWQEVSLRALQWSRETLAERQTAAIARMKAAVEGRAMLPLDEGCSEPNFEQTSTQAHVEEAANTFTPQNDVALVGSLRMDLEKLRTFDPRRCLLVRNLKKLGLGSQQRLQEHFEQFGIVSEVFVAHSYEKPSAKRRSGRIRSATKGFVVMEDAAMADAVFQAGETHVVTAGDMSHTVVVQRFNPVEEVDVDA